MDYEAIWQKVIEYAMLFYNFVMTEGENNFMLTNKSYFVGDGIPDEQRIIFIASFVIMILLAIFAADSFNLFWLFDEKNDKEKKISIFNVIIFTATVFSVHTFYKISVNFIGGFIGAYESVRALKCLGSYINPVSIMAYSFAISTLKFRRKWFQAFALGLATFFTPAIMSFSQITNENIAIYEACAAIAVGGAILHQTKRNTYVSYLFLSIIHYIAKFFIVLNSNRVSIITTSGTQQRIMQYISAIQVDLIISVVLLVFLFGYHVAITQKVNITIYLISLVLAVDCVIASFYISVVSGEYRLHEYEQAIMMYRQEEYLQAIEKFEELGDYEQSREYIERCRDCLYAPQYNKAVFKYNGGYYEDAMVLFSSIAGYKDAEERINDCQLMLNRKLVGIWNGSLDSMLMLYDNDTCYYIDGSSGEGEGTWYVSDGVLHVSTVCLSYELYAKLNEGYDTKIITILADSSSWNDEVFWKSSFETDEDSDYKLEGTWIDDIGRSIELYADKTCYYTDGDVYEMGDWGVSQTGELYIVFPNYILNAQLDDGYDTGVITITGDDWITGTFIRQEDISDEVSE